MRGMKGKKIDQRKEVEQDDPFTDEEDKKENRETQAVVRVVENGEDDFRAEEWC